MMAMKQERTMFHKVGLFAAGIAASVAFAGAAYAADVTIGVASEPSAMDPHYHNLGPNNAMAQHVFDRLVHQDPNQNLIPGLAVSWKPLDDTTWEFKLRAGVKFHDGSDFDAKDVLFTFDRIPKVPNSPSPFTRYVNNITEAQVVDPLTMRFKTASPRPLLPVELSQVNIMSDSIRSDATPESKTTEQLNNGDGTIGSGPYKFVEWVRGDRIVLAKNENYWGEKEPWDKVTFKPLSNNAARVAALLSGQVDMIGNPPSADLAQLRKNPKVSIFQAASNRVIYVHLDSFAEPSVAIPDTNGKNPLKDVRVRKALSIAINREAISDRVMEGLGIPAAELLTPGMFGTTPGIKQIPYDPTMAKKLLAEAGYPNGFTTNLGTPNDRYINDAQVAQAVAAMWERIGIKVNVQAFTKSVFFKTRNQYKFSTYLAGWGAGTGEMSSPLVALVATRNKEKGMGGTNRGRYSNPAMDAVVEQAMATGRRAWASSTRREPTSTPWPCHCGPNDRLMGCGRLRAPAFPSWSNQSKSETAQ
jgi:peptide/nickel transport system substrate-binding protein